MPDYVIWTRGLRGPAIAVKHGSATLTIGEGKTILSGPTLIRPEHDKLSLTELARHYPVPRNPDDLAPSAAPTKPAPVAPSEVGAAS